MYTFAQIVNNPRQFNWKSNAFIIHFVGIKYIRRFFSFCTLLKQASAAMDLIR